MEKFDAKATRCTIETLDRLINILNEAYSLFSELGVDKRGLRCLVKSKDLCRATIMQLFLLLGKHGKHKESNDCLTIIKHISDENK